MKALLVIDVQNGILKHGDFTRELTTIDQLIKSFKNNNLPIFYIRHLDVHMESVLHESNVESSLHSSIVDDGQIIVIKHTPSAFYKTSLQTLLDEKQVSEIVICGFNSEYCCLFTAIAAYDKGYQVTIIENAVGTANTGATYEIPGLDINYFIGTILHNSNVVQVIDYEDFQLNE